MRRQLGSSLRRAGLLRETGLCPTNFRACRYATNRAAAACSRRRDLFLPMPTNGSAHPFFEAEISAAAPKVPLIGYRSSNTLILAESPLLSTFLKPGAMYAVTDLPSSTA